ncbi:MAG: pentapeptide repeat-containing protein [Halobacteriovoraceae bacterium]|jgi:fluoroquinolone resistance protein|nr:pentapeptide repeat-containing protein [Halobacteriovoraceae bacterium]MBT5092694.1 pentapeptide repeat-containing protein [Halobacteriovoraceae bacterium]
MLDVKYYEEKDWTPDSWQPGTALSKSEFIGCTFTSLNFSEQDLAHSKFVECCFKKCNLSNVGIKGTTFRDVKFHDSKLVGINFADGATLFELKFEQCLLDLCVFQGVNSPNPVFNNCSLKEVDFSEAKLNGATFCGSNLVAAHFTNTDLSGADFRQAIKYSIDPTYSKIKKAKFSMPEAMGLLASLDITIE